MAGATATPSSGTGATDSGRSGAPNAGAAMANLNAGAASMAGGPGPSAGIGAGTAGNAAVGGSSGYAADGGAGKAGNPAPTTGCGNAAHNDNPFGCKFAWGTNDPGGSLSSYAELQFMSKWVGYEVDKDGRLQKCDGCDWLGKQVAGTSLVPVYYAYFIGYLGHANGFADGNQNPSGPNLTTDAANLIRDHRAQLVDMYRSYAKQSASVWPQKPLVWLLEGDFVQYAGDSQKNKLSYAELSQLANDITCAIKSQMSNAVVAINHSTWNSDQVTDDFWGSLANVNYDLVWTTGVANNQGFFEAGSNASSYNHATATYAYVHRKTARNILVDTSFGISAMNDSWSSAGATALNMRIDEGVIAANVVTAPANYVTTIKALESQLKPSCK
jgi:hypothetical protein